MKILSAAFFFWAAGWFAIFMFGENSKVTGELIYVMRAEALNTSIICLVGGILTWRSA